jgi:hypothetical protein
MITVSNFVGALMQALSSGRTMSDRISARIADHYLDHDYLRGFPVPRMTLKQVEVEVNFAVGSTTLLSTLLRQPEVGKNIINRFRYVLEALPGSDTFRSQFGQRAFRDEDWKQGTDELVASVEKILAEPPADKAMLQHLLVLASENFFYRLHQVRPQAGLLSGLRRVLGADEPPPAEEPAVQTDAVRTWITQQVAAVLDAAIPGGLEGADASPDLQILVGGGELEGRDAGQLHTAKLSFVSEDRKWVASEKNGEKTYILDR